MLQQPFRISSFTDLLTSVKEDAVLRREAESPRWPVRQSQHARARRGVSPAL